MTTRMLAGASAAPHELTHEGRTYRFRALSYSLMGEFEAWLIGRARGAICAVYAEGSAERAAELKQLRDDATDGSTYAFTGALAEKVRATPGGVLKLAALLMGCGDDDVLPLMMARGDEVRHLMALAIAESLPPGSAAAPEGADPNARPPGAA